MSLSEGLNQRTGSWPALLRGLALPLRLLAAALLAGSVLRVGLPALLAGPWPALIALSAALALDALSAATGARRRTLPDEGRKVPDAPALALQSLTGGRLLIGTPADLRERIEGELLWTFPLDEPRDVSVFRLHLREIARRRGWADERLDELCLCGAEAAGRAVRPGRHAFVQVWAAEKEITILTTNPGEPEATVGCQDMTRETPFLLMLAMTDTLALSAGPEGTLLLLRISDPSPMPAAEEEPAPQAKAA